MNKQEAIEKIKNIETLSINDIIAGQSVDMVIKNQVIDIIYQIDEPQKVIVPIYGERDNRSRLLRHRKKFYWK